MPVTFTLGGDQGLAIFAAGYPQSSSIACDAHAPTSPIGEKATVTIDALNHRNNLTKNPNFGSGSYPSNPSPTFGQVTAVNDPRSIQLALRFRF